MNKLLATTRGHKTLGSQWFFELWFSHQSSLYLDSKATPKSPTFHTAKRYLQGWKANAQSSTFGFYNR